MSSLSLVSENKVTSKTDSNQSNQNSYQTSNPQKTLELFTPTNNNYYSVESPNSILICSGIPCPNPW